MPSVELPELDIFADFCEQHLTLDQGGPFIVQPFQRQMLADFFDGARETLILLPKKNGKSTVLAALGLFHLLSTPDADCIIVAASREQADIILKAARGFVRRASSDLQSRLKVKLREIEYPDRGGVLKIRASDVDTVDGWIGTLGFIDEVHRHKSADLYGVIRDGLGPRKGRMVSISTAGADQNSVLWTMRQAAIDSGMKRDGAHIRAGTKAFVLHEWSLEPDADLDDIDLVKTANPLVPLEDLRERHDSGSMVPWQWARFACNIWTQGEEAWLPMGVWDRCAEEGCIEKGSAIWLGVDLGVKHDTAAIVAVCEEGEIHRAEATIITPPGGDRSLDIAKVEAAIRDLADNYDIQGVAYDPWRFMRSAQMLEDEGLLMIEHPMTNVRMAPESEALHEAIMRGRIVHNGDAEFASHINAGVPTETERGWRLSKRVAKDKIDALIALVIAYDLATLRDEEPVPSIFIQGM